MKDPSVALKNAYKTALDNLSVNSRQTPFHKYLKEATATKYMYIAGLDIIDDSPKDSFQSIASITIACVAPFNNAYGDTSEADDIADQVNQTINVKAGSYLSLTGFFLITTSLENSSEFIREEKGETQLVRTLRFRHIIGES